MKFPNYYVDTGVRIYFMEKANYVDILAEDKFVIIILELSVGSNEQVIVAYTLVCIIFNFLIY